MATKKNYKNETQYYRITHDTEHPYLMISNTLLRDENLDLLEIGIMVHLLSHDESYIINTSYIQKKCGIGQDRFYKAIKHLIELGYLIKVQFFGGVCWIINEIPRQVLKNGTISEKTSCLLTIRAKTNCLNTNCLNTNCLFHTLRNIDIPINNKPNKNEPNKNLPNKNESVVGEQGQENILGSDEPEEKEDTNVFDKVEDVLNKNTSYPKHESITPNIGFKELLPKGEPESITSKVEVEDTPIEFKDLMPKFENYNSSSVSEPLPSKLEVNTPNNNAKDPRYESELSLIQEYKFKGKYFIDYNPAITRNYETYSNKYPNRFMTIDEFEKKVFYFVYGIYDYPKGKITNEMVNKKMTTYRDEIFYKLWNYDITKVIAEMKENPAYTDRVLQITIDA